MDVHALHMPVDRERENRSGPDQQNASAQTHGCTSELDCAYGLVRVPLSARLTPTGRATSMYASVPRP